MYTETLPGDVNQGSHKMELRLASGSHRRPAVEPKEDGRSYQRVEVHQTLDLVLPSL